MTKEIKQREVVMLTCKKHPTYKGINPPKVDCRDCRVRFTQFHSQDDSNFIKPSEIASILDIDGRTVRRYKEGFDGKRVVNQFTNHTYQKESFRKFLIRGRTRVELFTKYGENLEHLLKEDYEGLALFTQRDRYNQERFILLPTFNPRELKIQPRKFLTYVAPHNEGLAQPYISVQLPTFKQSIEIAPLFDVHFGQKAHRHEKFLSYLRWIEETPNVYAILGGDLMENAIDDGRGMTYDQTETPQSQLDKMTYLLAPIAHKILCSTTGNHEERTYKKTGIDVARVLADRLKIPYFDGPIFLSVNANTFTWNFYIYHGRGNSQTKGGKMNAAGRARKFTNNIHFFISGHVHDAVAEPETVITVTPEGLTQETQWVVVCQSFLAWADTYAYRAGYAPPSRGGVAIRLFANGDYRALLT